MDIGAGLERVPRHPLEQVFDPARIGLALAARGDHGAVGVLGQPGGPGPAGGDQSRRLAEQVDDRAGFDRRALRPLGQPFTHPAGPGAGKGHDLGQFAL
jgi:hypothetical protein